MAEAISGLHPCLGDESAGVLHRPASDDGRSFDLKAVSSQNHR